VHSLSSVETILLVGPRGGVGSHDSAPASFKFANLSYVTVNVPELVAVPPGVVTLILPVFAPAGTVTVIFV
jgi:hypothetical protein